MKIKVYPVSVRGKAMWCGDIPEALFGKRIRLFRETEVAARLAAEGEFEELRQHGKAGQIGAEERAILKRFSGQLTVDKMAAALREAVERTATPLTVEKAVADYLDAPRERPLSKAHKYSLKSRFKHFVSAFGSRPISSLTAGEMQGFIRQQGASAHNYFSMLRALYRHAERCEWIERNPMSKVPAPEQETAEKTVYTPEQMVELLKRSKAFPNVLRSLVLGGFCGLRACEVARCRREHIDLEAGEIHVPKMKTQHRGIRERYVQLEPMALAWLKATPLPERGPVVTVNDRNFRLQRAEILAAGEKMRWLDNGLRRSFGSYHLAAFDDAARTAEMMGHTDAETTKAKYRVPRKKAVALAWWTITPESVASQAQATSAR